MTKTANLLLGPDIINMQGQVYTEYCSRNSVDLQNLIFPIISQIDLKYFFHSRIYMDGSEIAFSTFPELTNSIYDNSFNILRYRVLSAIDREYIVWTATTAETKYLYDFYSQKYKIGNGLSIIEKNKEYIDSFHFGGDYCNIGMTEYLINNTDLLKNICAYYKNKFQKKIASKESNRIFIPSRKVNLNKIIFSQNNRKFISLQLSMLKDKESAIFGDIKVSKREMEVLCWLANGKTAEETALILGLSKRTVEDHIKNMKDKFTAPNTHSLMAKVAALGIISLA